MVAHLDHEPFRQAVEPDVNLRLGALPERVTQCELRDPRHAAVPLATFTYTNISDVIGVTAARSIDGLPVVAEPGRVKTYSAFKNEWDRFVGRTGFEDARAYSLRHTFATLNLAHGENIRAISAVLGHASPSYTLDLYVGYTPSMSAELSNRYVDRLSGAPDGK